MSKHAFTVPPSSTIEIIGDGILTTTHVFKALSVTSVEITGGNAITKHALTVLPSSSIEVLGGGNSLTVSVLSEFGMPGLSAYQVAVMNGFVGNEAAWLASLSNQPATEFNVDLVNIYNLFK